MENKKVIDQTLHALNVPKHICNHLIGKEHSSNHRMIMGVFVMAVGVGVAKIPVTFEAFRFVCDMSGYLIHGLGCVPFIDNLINSINKERE